MKRLRLILALSHGCFAVGAVGLYANPDSMFGALIAVGAFTRWMVPYRPKHVEAPLFFLLKYGFILLLVYWLMDNGLSDVMKRAWHDRLSIRPITFFTSILLYLIAKDWLYFTKKTPSEVNSFYDKNNQVP